MSSTKSVQEFRVRKAARSASDAELIADLLRVGNEIQPRPVTRQIYDEIGQWHSSTLNRRLGGWAAACDKAGVKCGRPDLGHSDDVWMSEILDQWSALGRQPTYGDMRRSKFSPEGYARRFGSWSKALQVFENWVRGSEREIAVETRKRSRSASREMGRTPGARLRFAVLQRDRFRCVMCGASPATSVNTILHVDHVVPFSQNGPTEISNLRTLCQTCNLGKSDSVSS